MAQSDNVSIVGLPQNRARFAKRGAVEGAVQKSEEWLTLAIQGSQVGLWYWDKVKQELLWDAKTRKVFGAPAEGEVTLQTFLDALHPDDRYRVMRAWRQVLENRLPHAIDFRAMIPSSSVRWIHGRGSGYYDDRGKPLCMAGVVFDITDRKQTEQELRESEERFRLIADAAPVMIWMSGTDKLCNYFNRPWLEFTGEPVETQLGDGWTNGIHPEDLNFCLDTCSTAFDGRKSFGMQYRLRRKDGEYRWISDAGVPRFNDDGSFAGYVGSCIDVTERKLAEDALAGLSGRLIEAQEDERKRMARELHDDYAQRLAMLALDLEKLAETAGDSSVEVRRQLLELFDRVSVLGADLHSLSHGLHSSTLERLGLVAGLKDFCKEFAAQTGIHVDFVHENVPAGIPADAALCIFRIAQEALWNVKKHSGANRTDVRLEWAHDRLRLSVSDRGRGFDFAKPSSGIGIQSMEERLRLQGGRLEIQSTPLEGFRIDAWLPVNNASQRTRSRTAKLA